MASQIEMLHLIDTLYDMFKNDNALVAIEESIAEGRNIVIIRYLESDNLFADRNILPRSFWGNEIAQIRYEASPGIEPDLFYPTQDEEAELRMKAHVSTDIIGGTWTRNGRLSGYGTLSFAAYGIAISSCSHSISGRNVILSNNHVLAMWDQGIVGEPVDTIGGSNTAKLCCWLPATGTRCPNDLAMATRRNPADLRHGVMKGLPSISGRIVAPARGMQIRKSGARTSVTTGVILGFANIRVNGSFFRHVAVEDNNFSCAGDSGSAVFDVNMNLVGFHFAGAATGTCPRNGPGYFIPTDPGHAFGLAHPIEIEIFGPAVVN